MIPNCLVIKAFVNTKNRQTTNTTYWVPDAGPVSQGSLNLMAAIVAAEFAAKYLPILASESSFAGVKLTQYNGTEVLEAADNSGADDGGGSDDAHPDEVCLELQRRTGKLGRENRGRIFISGIPEDIDDAGTLKTPGYRVACKALAAYLGADRSWGELGFHARHWNRKTNTLVPVSEFRVMNVLVSRRDRRKPLVPISIGH